MRISVALATHNGERFLQEQLDSLAAQSLLPFELVASDDASGDSTIPILNRFARSAAFPVTILSSNQALGSGPNFLKAAAACRGDAIAYCDQDDVWFKQKLACCAGALIDPAISLVIHKTAYTDSCLRPTGELVPMIPRRRRRHAGFTLKPMDSLGMAMLARRRLFDLSLDNSHLFSAFGNCHDSLIRFVAQASGIIHYIDEVLAYHRCHGQNASQSHTPITRTLAAHCAMSGKSTCAAMIEWLRIHGNAALQSGTLEQRGEIEALRTRRENFARALEIAPPDLEKILRRAIAWVETSIACKTARAEMYGTQGIMARGIQLARMVGGGTYGRRNSGRLGLQGLAKDAVFVCARGATHA